MRLPYVDTLLAGAMRLASKLLYISDKRNLKLVLTRVETWYVIREKLGNLDTGVRK